jgi:hypothetical protein
MKKNFAALVLLALFSPSAFAFDFSAVGGLTLSNYSYDAGTTSSGMSFGVGGLLGHQFAPAIGLETGALYLSRRFDLTVSGVTASTTGNYVDVPILLRLSPAPFFFLEAGGYVGLGLSSTVAVGAISVSGGAPGLDAGLRGVAGLRIPLGPKVALRAQGQYSWGLVNAAAATNKAYSRSIDVLGGVAFVF